MYSGPSLLLSFAWRVAICFAVVLSSESGVKPNSKFGAGEGEKKGGKEGPGVPCMRASKDMAPLVMMGVLG